MGCQFSFLDYLTFSYDQRVIEYISLGSEGINRANYLDYALRFHAFSDSVCFLLYVIQNIKPQQMKVNDV